MIQIDQTNQMSEPNALGIKGFSDTGTVTGTLFADPNPKEKLFLLVNNVPKVFHKFLP
jgi:hypothetical protein